jgi:putative spermidine/putrescine transport system substrate-binding protein
MESLGLRLSRRKLLVSTTAGIGAAALPATARADTPVVSVVDTVSGPNFQAFWNTYLIPEIKKQLGIDVKYTVGSGPTLQLQMKSWGQDHPGFSLLFLKDLDLSNAVRSGIALESLYPAHAKEIPNAADIPPEFLASSEGVQLNGEGLIFWRSQFDLIYNSAFVKQPPKTWKEFFDRRKEFDGHIGLIRPDAGSGGGRAFIYSFLAAFGVDFSKPFSEIQNSPAWKSAWDAFSEFSKSFAQPVASSAPVLFHQFQTEQVWMTSYAQDYSLWSTTQGQLPPTVKASPLDVNIIGASHAFLAVPKVDSDAQKEAAYKVINLLLSPEVQLHMLETMYQYPGTNAWKQAPASVWEKIPPVDQAESRSIRISNLDAVNYIQQHGMDYIAH